MSKTAEPSVISLPSGGGALRGLGEKFAPDPQTGTGNLSVPLGLPPGRNGFQPSLTLTYSSGQGNGSFGMGWGISVPRISRKTSHGIPRYDERDIFLSPEGEDLVAVPTAARGVQRYRPRTEVTFARIERFTAEQDSTYWQITTRAGETSLYGAVMKPEEMRALATATISDPQDPSRVVAWLLRETRDTFGNRISYEYARLDGEVQPSPRTEEPYLTTIQYCDYGDSNTPAGLIEVRLKYERRPDVLHNCRAGFEITTSMRCVAIEVWTHADTPILTRTYRLAYADQVEQDERLHPLNGTSLLAQIHLVAGEEGSAESLPPLTFTYTALSPSTRTRLVQETSGELARHSLANDAFELVDLFANGLPSVMQLDGFRRYWRNLGGGRFAPARAMANAPPDVSLSDRNVQLAELVGDGRPTLLRTSQPETIFYSLGADGWDRTRRVRYEHPLQVSLSDPRVKLVDLDGDGIADAMRTGPKFELYFNEAPSGWRFKEVPRKDLAEFPNVSFDRPDVRLADMTGDGLQDIVRIRSGLVEYWPYLGYGKWGRRVSMANAPRFEGCENTEGYSLSHVLLTDVDGDGCADLVYVASGKVTAWINQAGNGWSTPTTVRGTPPVSDIRAVRVADILGKGIPSILFTYGYGNSNHSILDFTDTKPYLLCNIDNGIGSKTSIEYASSTHFYLADEQRQETRWATTLPFPVHVVSKVVTHDEISGGQLTTNYSYHHGYWDGREREFRGFGRVDQRDAEDLPDSLAAKSGGRSGSEPHQGPPIETRAWFHLGGVETNDGDIVEPNLCHEYFPEDPPLPQPVSTLNLLSGLTGAAHRSALRALRGRMMRMEVYALDGDAAEHRPYTVTEACYGLREEVSDDGNRKPVLFPHLAAERSTQWERGSDPKTQIRFVGDYDLYGQPRTELSIGVPRGRDYRQQAAAAEPYLATYIEKQYAQPDNEQYLVDRIASTITSQIMNDGSATAEQLWRTARTEPACRRIIGQTLHFYDGDAFVGLAAGKVGTYGALVRTEQLVLTSDILHEAYHPEPPSHVPPELPPFPWTTAEANLKDYPGAWRAELLPMAGYVLYRGDPVHVDGNFAVTERLRYDVQEGTEGRGLVTARRDALGRDTYISYDRFGLCATSITDAVGLSTNADYDYRVLRPSAVTDTNGNRTQFTYTSIGLLASVALLGKADAPSGDSLEEPSLRYVYDYQAFIKRKQPISVRTIRRLYHVNDLDVPDESRNETVESIEFSDGFGRVVQMRSSAADVLFRDVGLPSDQTAGRGEATGSRRATNQPLNVLVTGWQLYDNKGRVVEQYEPRWSTGWEYAPLSEAECGQKVRINYDGLGRVTRTIYPDSSERLVVHGVPHDLAHPEEYDPTPWESFVYDPADNAGRVFGAAAAADQSHWDTPTSTLVDALGRTVTTCERLGRRATEELVTRCRFDIRGNLLDVIDAAGRTSFRQVHDLLNRRIHLDHLDAGVSQAVLDAAGQVVEERDARGSLRLFAYDALGRIMSLWARDQVGEALTLREHIVYGDTSESGLTREQARGANLLGRPIRHYDEAGLLTLHAYDFKGNVVEKSRQLLDDSVIIRSSQPSQRWNGETFHVDWQPTPGTSWNVHAGALLEAAVHVTSMRYDALNRVSSVHYPAAVDGRRRVLHPTFDRAGALKRLEFDGKIYIDHIAYNARGQRTLIAYGNGIMTRHAYDPKTSRLARTRTERYQPSGDCSYRPMGAALADSSYSYDESGNPTTIRERSPGAGVPGTPLGPDALDRAFSYDPLYRLVAATGRECGEPPPLPPWLEAPRSNDVKRARPYTEHYTYDTVGNTEQLRHTNVKPDGKAETRTQKYVRLPTTNRLFEMTTGSNRYRYEFDAAGNMRQENTSRFYEWDHAGRLRSFRTQAGKSEPSEFVSYLYDASGARMKKVTRKQGGLVASISYLDGIIEEHRRADGQATTLLHVVDKTQQIALIRVGPPLPGDGSPEVAHHIPDHLGNCVLVVDAAGTLVSREEFSPYGDTVFGSYTRKRYRFAGKERDDESGLYYYGDRYYAPWLSCWISVDPELRRQSAALAPGFRSYALAANNPIRYRDPTGAQARPTTLGAAWEILNSRNAATVGTEAGAPTSARDGGSTTGSPTSEQPYLGFLPEAVARDPLWSVPNNNAIGGVLQAGDTVSTLRDARWIRTMREVPLTDPGLRWAHGALAQALADVPGVTTAAASRASNSVARLADFTPLKYLNGTLTVFGLVGNANDFYLGGRSLARSIETGRGGGAQAAGDTLAALGGLASSAVGNLALAGEVLGWEGATALAGAAGFGPAGAILGAGAAGYAAGTALNGFLESHHWAPLMPEWSRSSPDTSRGRSRSTEGLRTDPASMAGTAGQQTSTWIGLWFAQHLPPWLQ